MGRSLPHPHVRVPWTLSLAPWAHQESIQVPSAQILGEHPQTKSNTFPSNQHLNWSCRIHHLLVRLSHQTRNVGPIPQPSSCPIPCAGLQLILAHVGARASPGWAAGRMVSQAPTRLFQSPTKLLGNVSGKRIFNIFFDLFRKGIIYSDAKGDSCRSSSKSRTGMAHPTLKLLQFLTQSWINTQEKPTSALKSRPYN